MENLTKYINWKHNDLIKSNFDFECLFEIIHNQGDRVFCEFLYNYQIKKVTYTEMRNYCFKMATFLDKKISCGVDNFVGLHMENSINWIAIFWSLLMLGYKPVLLNCKLPININFEILVNMNVKDVICADSAYDEIENLNVIKLENSLDYIHDVLDLDNYKPINWANQIALSTTATTQNYKICIYTGKDITYQVLNTKKIVSDNKMIRSCYKQSIKMLCFLPFYHIFGLVASYFWFSIFGRVFVFLNDYSSDTIIKTIQRHEVTHIFAVPLLWNTIVKEIKKSVSLLSEKEQKKFKKGLKISYKIQNIFPVYGISIVRKLFRRVIEQTLGNSVKFMISGGGYVSDETLYILNGVGYPLFNGYGSTELGITSVELRKKAKYRTLGSVGKPFTSVDYCIKEDLLHVKGNSTCSYIISRDGTKIEVDKTLFFNSNDISKIDKKSYYYILGRNDDVVIDSTGEKINPDIVEKNLLLTTVNNYCITNYLNELTFIFEISNYNNLFKLNNIYNEVKNVLSDLETKGYKISKVYYTNDAMVNKNAIKVSRKLLNKRIINGDVKLYSFENMMENNNVSTIDISEEIIKIVKAQFEDVLAKKIEEKDYSKHFIFELGGSSLDYCSLLMKLKKEFNMDFDLGQNGLSSIEEFGIYISNKHSEGEKNEKI